MEYLEMRGEVKLKDDADLSVVSKVLSKLVETEFVNGGYIDIRRKDPTISIHAEGTISESYSLRAQLRKLQNQLSETSMIGVTSERWETLVILKHSESVSALSLEPYDLLVVAQ